MNNFHVYEAIGRGKHSVTPLSAFLSSSSLCSPRPRIRSDWVQMGEISDLFLVFFFFLGAVVRKTVYKGRKKKSIEYFAVKSVDKSQRSKVLNEVSAAPSSPCSFISSSW